MQVQLGVQHITAAVAQQRADRGVGRAAWIVLARLPQQRRDHGFGGAIAVEQVGRTQCPPGQVVAGLGHRITTEAVHPHRRWVAVALGVFGQLLQVHRWEHPHGHAVAMHLGVGLLRQPQVVVADQYPGTVDQRVHPAFMGAVEGERHEVQFAIGRGHFVALAGGDDVRHQRPVGHRHALGQAGGAGGVDHIRQVVAVQCHVRGAVVGATPLLGTVHRQALQAFWHR